MNMVRSACGIECTVATTLFQTAWYACVYFTSTTVFTALMYDSSMPSGRTPMFLFAISVTNPVPASKRWTSTEFGRAWVHSGVWLAAEPNRFSDQCERLPFSHPGVHPARISQFSTSRHGTVPIGPGFGVTTASNCLQRLCDPPE